LADTETTDTGQDAPAFAAGHEKGPSPSVQEALHSLAAAHHGIADGHHAAGEAATHAANALSDAADAADDGEVADLLGGESTDSGGSAARSAQARGLAAVRSNPTTARTFNALTGRR